MWSITSHFLQKSPTFAIFIWNNKLITIRFNVYLNLKNGRIFCNKNSNERQLMKFLKQKASKIRYIKISFPIKQDPVVWRNHAIWYIRYYHTSSSLREILQNLRKIGTSKAKQKTTVENRAETSQQHHSKNTAVLYQCYSLSFQDQWIRSSTQLIQSSSYDISTIWGLKMWLKRTRQ